MTSLKKHLKNKITFFFLLIITLYSCTKEEKKENIIVKINDAILTDVDLDSMLNDSSNKTKLKDELINNWIENEILFQQAKKEKILEDIEFQRLLEKSKKKLAITIYIKKLLEENDFQIKDDEVKNYYEENKNEFSLIDDFFVLKIIYFKNFQDALKFREKLIELNWTLAENYFKTQNTEYTIKTISSLRKDIQPIQLLRIVNYLNKNDISSIIELDANEFCIVQLLEKYNVGEIPQLQFVFDKIKQKLTLQKQKEFFENHLKELVNEHNIEIERF